MGRSVQFERDERVERRRARRRQVRRRRIAALLVLGGVVALVFASTTSVLRPGGSSGGAEAISEATPPPVVPRCGRTILPNCRVVAFYGSPGGTLLGILGDGTPNEVAPRLEVVAGDYGSLTRPVLPAFELIATIVRDTPQEDGLYRSRLSDEQIDDYLKAARQHGMILILDIQPGRADFLKEVKHYEKWLKEPDVSLALDPEWSMGPDEIPGKVIGQTNAKTINDVSAYLNKLVVDNNLPQKLLIIHEFTESMIEDRADIVQRPNLATVFNVDGFGTPEAKVGKYEDLTTDEQRPEFLYSGFKLFYEEDTRNNSRVMTPFEVLDLEPQPDVVVYE